MKIEKLNSGSYRVRKVIDGVRVSVVFDHPPKESEIIQALSAKAAQSKKPKSNITLAEAIDCYLDLKKDRLSDATQREYSRLSVRLSEAILGTCLDDIDQFVIDREIASLLGRGLAPGTIDDYISNAATIIKRFRPDFTFKKDMIPEEEKKEEEEEIYIPTKEEVKALLQYTDEHCPQYYIPFALAASCGLRREEILPLTPDDIDDQYDLHITKAIVEGRNGWVEKGTKKAVSKRIVPISKDLADRIKQQGYVYKGSPGQIGKALHRVIRQMGLKHFTLHKLRHFFVTELWQAGVPEPDILYLSGHSKRSDINKIVYTHPRIQNDKDRRRAASKLISDNIL